MKKKVEMYGGDMIAEYEETQELKDEVFQLLMDWFKMYDVNHAEAFQNDDPQIYAQDVLVKILRRIDFKTTWRD